MHFEIPREKRRKKVKTKKARAALAEDHLLQPLPQFGALLPAGMEDERGHHARRNYHYRHLQHK